MLIARKQTPESSRQSLRALARQVGTSHQLLTFYLKSLERWQIDEYWRQAKEIRARAYAEDRPLTQQEAQQAHGYDREGIRATIAHMLLDDIDRMKKESECHPLHWQEIRALKIYAREFPEAQELLQKCSRSRVKNKKSNLPTIPDGAAKSFRREKE